MSYIGNTPFTAAFLVDTFSGNGSTVAFTMSVAPANTSSILVAVTGVVQDPSTYSVSGTTLTFSAAPPSGTSNISVRYLGIPASGVTTTAYRTQTEFTATAGQTTFTVPSYTVGYIDVYRNGLLLGSADFTATTGTTVVLAAAASAGDFIETVSFYVSSVLNAIPATASSVSTTYLQDASVTQAKLAAGVAGNGPVVQANNTSTQNFSAGTTTKVLFQNASIDTASRFSSSTFTPNVAGYYFVYAQISPNANTSQEITLGLAKNGSVINRLSRQSGNSSYITYNGGSMVVYCNGSTDYIEIYLYTQGAVTTETTYSTFSAALVRSA